MANLTSQDVSDIIHAGWESDMPDKVLEALRPYDGKVITTRLLPKLAQATGLEWRLRRQYGMTHLETVDYGRSSGHTGYSLLVSHTESSTPLNLRDIEERNPTYFSGRRERNHARMEAMNTRDTLDTAADTLNSLRDAYERLTAAYAAWETLAGYGTPLNADKYALERHTGIRETASGGPMKRIW